MANTLVDGLWSVEFGVPSSDTYGAGILVFINGGIYGGDSGYYYIGTYNIVENKVTANITIKHHYGPKNNVLGQGIGEISMELSGEVYPEKFTVSNGTFMAVLKLRESLVS